MQLQQQKKTWKKSHLDLKRNKQIVKFITINYYSTIQKGGTRCVKVFVKQSLQSSLLSLHYGKRPIQIG